MCTLLLRAGGSKCASSCGSRGHQGSSDLLSAAKFCTRGGWHVITPSPRSHPSCPREALVRGTVGVWAVQMSNLFVIAHRCLACTVYPMLVYGLSVLCTCASDGVFLTSELMNALLRLWSVSRGVYRWRHGSEGTCPSHTPEGHVYPGSRHEMGPPPAAVRVLALLETRMKCPSMDRRSQGAFQSFDLECHCPEIQSSDLWVCSALHYSTSAVALRWYVCACRSQVFVSYEIICRRQVFCSGPSCISGNGNAVQAVKSVVCR